MFLIQRLESCFRFGAEGVSFLIEEIKIAIYTFRNFTGYLKIYSDIFC